MTTGIYRAASAMDATARRLDAVANNLANVNTPAFKRRTTTFHSTAVPRRESNERVIRGRIAADLSQGSIFATGRDLDLALEGRGFFAVDKPGGEAYTRDGSFRLDQDGVLITADGHPVAWDALRGRLDPVGEPITFDSEGNVRQGVQEIGRLRLVGFANEGALRLDPEGYWQRPAGLEEEAHTAHVHQGHLEGSNVNAVEELVALVQIQRTYQSAASALSAIERSYRRLNRG
jgi:flagellar basal-body rod protein FlgF